MDNDWEDIRAWKSVITNMDNKVPKTAKRPQPKGGSRKGKPNKVTAELKDMILQALTKAGGVEYLTKQAREKPAAFLPLLGKVLPMQVNANVDGSVTVNIVRYGNSDPAK
jgi:hypothetical protein